MKRCPGQEQSCPGFFVARRFLTYAAFGSIRFDFPGQVEGQAMRWQRICLGGVLVLGLLGSVRAGSEWSSPPPVTQAAARGAEATVRESFLQLQIWFLQLQLDRLRQQSPPPVVEPLEA